MPCGLEFLHNISQGSGCLKAETWESSQTNRRPDPYLKAESPPLEGLGPPIWKRRNSSTQTLAICWKELPFWAFSFCCFNLMNPKVKSSWLKMVTVQEAKLNNLYTTTLWHHDMQKEFKKSKQVMHKKHRTDTWQHIRAKNKVNTCENCPVGKQLLYLHTMRGIQRVKSRIRIHGVHAYNAT